jgi:hypothetical protein
MTDQGGGKRRVAIFCSRRQARYRASVCSHSPMMRARCSRSAGQLFGLVHDVVGCDAERVLDDLGGISTGVGASVGQSNAVSSAASIGNGSATTSGFSNTIGVGVGGGFTNVLP